MTDITPTLLDDVLNSVKKKLAEEYAEIDSVVTENPIIEEIVEPELAAKVVYTSRRNRDN